MENANVPMTATPKLCLLGALLRRGPRDRPPPRSSAERWGARAITWEVGAQAQDSAARRVTNGGPLLAVKRLCDDS